LLGHHAHNLYVHDGDKILIYEKRGDVFAFNLNPTQSFTGYFVPTPSEGDYEAVLCTDDKEFGGFGRIDEKVRYHAENLSDDRSGFLAYLPSRCGLVYRKIS
ncbi:MAG: alpha amylase C-terminal domain-containing protein, partial [Lachnospiraceae bacterium]|nr:alpha amylase C-terminal domain-containing protein [Lachnospiraceae bacterium]